mgnify:CR=1 FL=1
MAHTNFKHGIPYNNVRLGGDVAQWSLYEESYTNDSSFDTKQGILNISMADMQRASDTNIDPDGGRVQIGPLSTMRYGIANLGDVSTGDGVYTYQVGGTNSDFVGTRSFNLSSNPANIRLSRFTAWDYTAAVHPTDMDPMDFYTGGSSIWLQTARYGCELFKDYPIFATGVKQNGSNNTRRPLVIQSGLQGDQYSSYTNSNFAAGTHASDMNDILTVVPLTSTYGKTLGTAIASYATIGRRTSSTGNGKVQAYSITINADGSFSTATTGTALNMSTGASSNYAAAGSCYIDDGLFAVVGGRGNGGFYINRVTWNGSSFSSTSTSLSTTSDFGADRGDVVSLLDNFGATNKYCAAVWTETKSTVNRYCRIQMFNFNSNISTVGSEGTVFDVNNSLKSARATLLASNPSNAWVLVGVSDSSGDVRLKVMRYNINTNNWTALDDATYQYNDTSVNNLFSLTTLSAVNKTAIQKSGEAFLPGQSNDYKRRVYFALSVSTNSETDDVELQYGYYDIDADLITFTVSGVLDQGRNASVAKNHYGTDARDWAEYTPVRNNAGPIYMPIIGGRYIGSSNKRLSLNMLGLDYKPNWDNGVSGDPPGGVTFDTVGTGVSTNMNYTGTSIEPGWDAEGVWDVQNHHPSLYTVGDGATGYAGFYAYRLYYGPSVRNVSPYTWRFWCSSLDTNNNDWSDFFSSTLFPYLSNNVVYVRIRSGETTKTAFFTLNLNGNSYSTLNTYVNQASFTNTWANFGWVGISNSHSADSWSFPHIDLSEVGITFSQTPF